MWFDIPIGQLKINVPKNKLNEMETVLEKRGVHTRRAIGPRLTAAHAGRRDPV